MAPASGPSLSEGPGWRRFVASSPLPVVYDPRSVRSGRVESGLFAKSLYSSLQICIHWPESALVSTIPSRMRDFRGDERWKGSRAKWLRPETHSRSGRAEHSTRGRFSERTVRGRSSPRRAATTGRVVSGNISASPCGYEPMRNPDPGRRRSKRWTPLR